MRNSLVSPSFAVSTLLFAAALALAVFSDWQYDEAWTYNGVDGNSIWELLRYDHFQFANHQLLNSLYFKAIQALGASHVVHYRWLSLISLAVFIYANIKLFEEWGIRKALIAVVLISPLLIWFSLGRGYAPALAAFACALLFLVRFSRDPSLKNGYLFIASGMIAMLSIFSFVYVVAGLLAIYIWRNRHALRSVHFYIQLIAVLATIGYVYYAGSIINMADPYIIGADTLWYGGTLSSVAETFIGYRAWQSLEFRKVLKVGYLVLLCLPIVIAGAGDRRRRDFFRQASIPLFLILCSLTLMTLAHLVFGAKYPLGRAVIYLPYLLLLLSVLASASLNDSRLYVTLVLLAVIGVLGNYSHLRELTRPSLSQILEHTRSQPLFVYSNNPNILLVNRLQGIHDEESITRFNTFKELRTDIGASGTNCFVLLPRELEDSIHLEVTSKMRCRDGNVLLSVGP